MSDRDFVSWCGSPSGFFRQHRSLFNGIIARNSFVNHKCSREKAEWELKLMHLMESPEVMIRLNQFSHKSSFLTFYTAILRDVVIAKNQEEDVELIENNFPALIVKYRQMVEIIAGQLCQMRKISNDQRMDVTQQALTNLLAKKDTIVSSYDFQRIFRNFIWKITQNEIKNIIKAMSDKKLSFRNQSEPYNDDHFDLNASEYHLAVAEVLEYFHCKVLTYMHLRSKLLLCLKVLYNHHIYPNDIRSLFDHQQQTAGEDFTKISALLNHAEKTEEGKLKRYELIKPFLDLAGNTSTDARSYWRWTNHEAARLISYLNNHQLTSFNHESFGLLLDRYFENYTGAIQIQNQ